MNYPNFTKRLLPTLSPKLACARIACYSCACALSLCLCSMLIPTQRALTNNAKVGFCLFMCLLVPTTQPTNPERANKQSKLALKGGRIRMSSNCHQSGGNCTKNQLKPLKPVKTIENQRQFRHVCVF